METTAWGFLLAGVLVGAVGAWIARGRTPSSGSDASKFVAQHLPIGALLFAEDGLVRYANKPACDLLFRGESAEGRNFLRLLAGAPAPVGKALASSQDALVTVEHEGEQQSFQLLRRSLSYREAPHTLLLLNPLTEELVRREIDLLKKVIRVINHELNNSLASMSSLVSSGRYIIDHPEQLPRLVKVLDGIEGRTTHLTHFLSEYAQLSKLPLARPKLVPWSPMLERLGELYPAVVIGKAPEEVGWFDEVQVEQAVINLLKNAVEAGGAEGTVQLLVRQVDGLIEIAVLDRGTGFSDDALQHGLLPFYSTKEGGSGVGLALCREVASGHGGTLRVKARDGGGSLVALSLPRQTVTRIPKRQVALTLTRT